MNNKRKFIGVAFQGVAITAVLAATYIGIRYVMLNVLHMPSTLPLVITYVVVVSIAGYAYWRGTRRYIRGDEVDIETELGWLSSEKLSSPFGVKAMFWFVGLVVIPVLGYIYSYPLALILSAFRMDGGEKALTIVSLAGGVVTYYAMWKRFKN